MAFHETSTITEIKNKILSMGRPLVLKKGETIFRQGDSFECLYVLCSGSAKTLLLSNDGDEQLTDFYFPNDIIGFSSIEQKTHSVTAITLELSSVYEISADKMKKLSTEDLFVLQTLILHDGLTLENYSNASDETKHLCRKKFMVMLEKGILIQPKQKFNINPIIYEHIHNYLSSKNYIH